MLWPIIIWQIILTITVIILPIVGIIEFKYDIINTILALIIAVGEY